MAMTMYESEPPLELHPDLHTDARGDDAQTVPSASIPSVPSTAVPPFPLSPVPMRPIPMPLTEKTLVYSCAMTYAEYVDASPRLEFLEMRAREIRLLPEAQAYFTGYPDPVQWVIVVDDGPDTLVVLPLLAHVAAWAPRLSMRLVRDEEAAELLAALVEDAELLAQWAEADLPLLLSFDDEWHFQEQWGPHPQAMDGLLEQWLAAHEEYDQLADQLDDQVNEEVPVAGQQAYARLQERLLQEMRLWYNSSLNHAAGAELHALLARWHDENGDENGDEHGDAGAG